MEENNNNFEPRIIAFVCNWCTYAGADRRAQTVSKYAKRRDCAFPWGAYRFHVAAESLRGRCRRNHHFGLPPQRLPLYTSGKFPRTPPLDGVPRHALTSWASTSSASAGRGSRLPKVPNGLMWSTTRSTRYDEMGPYTEYKKAANFRGGFRFVMSKIMKDRCLLRKGR